MVHWSVRVMQRGVWGVLLLNTLSSAARAQLQGGLQYHYVGCVRNEGQYVLAAPPSGSDTAMTNDICVARCRTQRFFYAGTQASQCFCGTTAGRPAEEPSCSTPCPGNAAQACGGAGVLSLYTTMVSQPPPPLANRPLAPMLLQPPNAWTPALPATAVQFQWQHPGASPASPVRFWFTLEQYHTAAQQWVLVLQTWSPTGTGLLVQGLAPGSYYRWQVAAFDGVLWSAPSAAAFFATRPP